MCVRACGCVDGRVAGFVFENTFSLTSHGKVTHNLTTMELASKDYSNSLGHLSPGDRGFTQGFYQIFLRAGRAFYQDFRI